MKKKSILVVDDDASVRNSLGKVLTGAGFEVSLAAGGLDAIARLTSRAVDLVLLDIGLPNQNGWETCKYLAREHTGVPIILITGRAGQFNSALASGAVALMEKPFDAYHLLQVTHDLLAKPMATDPYRSRGTLHDQSA